MTLLSMDKHQRKILLGRIAAEDRRTKADKLKQAAQDWVMAPANQIYNFLPPESDTLGDSRHPHRHWTTV